MRQLDAIPCTDDIGIFGGPSDQLVTNKSADEITGYTQLRCRYGNFIEYVQLFFGAGNVHKGYKGTFFGQQVKGLYEGVEQLLIPYMKRTFKMTQRAGLIPMKAAGPAIQGLLYLYDGTSIR